MASLTCLPKIAIIPLEGAMKGIPIMTSYNPETLTFTKNAEWNDLGAGYGVDYAIPQFTGGKAIELTGIEFYFDNFESDLDVRLQTTPLVHLCEAQEIDEEETLRPPMCQLVWVDPNPLMLGKPYTCVVKSVEVSYLMFNEAGLPVRASVKVGLVQADSIGVKESKGDESFTIVKTAGMTAARLEALGAKSEIEKDGGKIEDPSTWPAEVRIKIKK